MKKRSGRPAQLSRDPLDEFLIRGRDIGFRDFIADLFAVAGGMQSIRRAVARRSGISGTSLAILLAVWRLGRDEPIGIRGVSDNLHVAAANITSEVNSLVQLGLLAKQADPDDQRAVRLTMTDQGRDFLADLAPLLRDVNEILFDGLSPIELARLQDYVGRVLGRIGVVHRKLDLQAPTHASKFRLQTN